MSIGCVYLLYQENPALPCGQGYYTKAGGFCHYVDRTKLERL